MEATARVAVSTHGLSKRYGRRGVLALDGLDLEVPSGCCFGLLGPNGAGKSTLVKTLLSIVRPTRGSAHILGHDIRNPSARRQVGYLPEGPRFPRYLRAATMCRYFGQLAGLRGRELSRQVAEKIELVGMQDRARDRIAGFSKGMTQRMGLAQALLGDPELLFLDEPTDGVDPLGRKHIREVIRVARSRGATVFINSHLLAEVEQVCDRVAILVGGRLLRQGTIDEITGSLPRAGGLEVRFRTGTLSDETWQRLANALSSELSCDLSGARREGPELVVLLPDEPAIVRTIDHLRSAQVDVFAVTPTKLSLEEAFLQLVAQEQPQTGTRS